MRGVAAVQKKRRPNRGLLAPTQTTRHTSTLHGIDEAGRIIEQVSFPVRMNLADERERFTRRLEAFSDLVFGFSLSLLATRLDVPTRTADIFNPQRWLPFISHSS